MTKQPRRTRHNSARRLRSGANRSPLLFELLEPRTLLAGAWPAHPVPDLMDSFNAEVISTSADPAGHGAGVDHHGCCGPEATGSSQGPMAATSMMDFGHDFGHTRMDPHECCRVVTRSEANEAPLMTAENVAESLPAAGMMEHHGAAEDHADCCRVYPAAPATDEALVAATATMDSGMMERHGAVEDHADCCRVYPAAPATDEALVAATATMDSGMMEHHGAVEDHADCCRVLPPSDTPEAPAMTAEVMRGEAGSVPANVPVIPDLGPVGQGEAALEQPALVVPPETAPHEEALVNWPAEETVAMEAFVGGQRRDSLESSGVDGETPEFAAALDTWLAESPFPVVLE